MTKALRLSLVLALALAAMGCKKSDSTGSAPSGAPPAGSAAQAPGAASGDDGEHGGWGRHMGSGLSEADRDKARHDRAEAMLKTMDKNGDGVVTVDEVKQAPGRFAADAETIDADHDGKITADELATYMKERRGRGHHRRGASGGSGGDAEGSADGSAGAGSDSP